MRSSRANMCLAFCRSTIAGASSVGSPIPDPAFAMRVRRWQDNLETLDEDYGDIKPPAHVFSASRPGWLLLKLPRHARACWHRSGHRSPSGASLRWAESFWPWAWHSLAARRSEGRAGSAPGRRSVRQGQPFGLVAAYDRETGLMRLTAAAASGDEPKVLELWLVEADQPPVSLGLASQDGMGEFVVPASAAIADRRGRDTRRQLEPPGGSPTGSPTGPVVAAGRPAFPDPIVVFSQS